jgi:hypothetical protein
MTPRMTFLYDMKKTYTFQWNNCGTPYTVADVGEFCRLLYALNDNSAHLLPSLLVNGKRVPQARIDRNYLPVVMRYIQKERGR